MPATIRSTPHAELPMAMDAIVRISFESNVYANQAANKALVGHATWARRTGPFERVGTALYQCRQANDHEVGEALERLGTALKEYSHSLDFVSISLVRGT